MHQDPYAPQYPYQPDAGPYQSQPAAPPYPSQYPYQPQSGAAPYAPQYPYQPQPGAAPYPQQYPYQPQYPYPPQQFGAIQRNPRASRAMIYGILSIVLGVLTLATLVGYAGLITGTFAIIYGFIGLNRAKRLPGNVGRAQAIVGIVLGSAAWFLVIASLIVRAAMQG